MSLKKARKPSRCPNVLEKISSQQGPHLDRTGGEGFDPGRDKAEKSLDAVEWPGFAVRQQQPTGHRIEPFQILEKARDHIRILSLPVVKQHVAAKVRIAAQDFIRAFSGDDDLVAGVAHGTAQQVLGDAMSIEAKRLGLQDGIGKMIGQIVLPDGDGEEFGSRLRGHLARFFFLVVVGVVEGQGEGTNRFGMMSRRQAEDRTGVEPATEVTTHRNVGAQTDANRFLQRLTKLGGVVGIGTRRRGPVGPGIVEIPILVQLNMLFGCDQVVAGRNLKNPVKKRAHRMPAEFDGVIDGLGIPTSRHSRGKQRFHFRREIKRFLVEGIEERLDTEAVAGGEDRPVGFIPEYKGEFAAQSVQALRAEIFIEMKSDLAVGAGAQAVTRAVRARAESLRSHRIRR